MSKVSKTKKAASSINKNEKNKVQEEKILNISSPLNLIKSLGHTDMPCRLKLMRESKPIENHIIKSSPNHYNKLKTLYFKLYIYYNGS